MKKLRAMMVSALCLSLVFGFGVSAFAKAEYKFTLSHTEPTNVSTHLQP